MAKTYRILLDQGCTELQFANLAEAAQILPLDGTPKAKLLPNRPISAVVSKQPSRESDFASINGNIAIKDSTRHNDKIVYYGLLGCEQIAIDAQSEYYYLLNPDVFRPEYGEYGMRKQYAPLFRLVGRPSSEFFCVEDIPGEAGFKSMYDHCKLRGLTFVEVAKETTT